MVKSLLSANMKSWLSKSMSSELYASNLYKQLANKMQKQGYFGAQKYFLKESADELTHYQKLVDFVNNMGDVLDVPKVDAIKEAPDCIGDALEIAYEAELDLLNQYKEFHEVSEDEDCAVSIFLHEFVMIQVKSVGEYGDLIARYEIADKTKEWLEFDEYMGEL